MMASSLIVIETHPVQYRAPLYRTLQQRHGVPVTVIYGSDFSVAGYEDREFGSMVRWDTDLLSGYQPVFLSRVKAGGGRSFGDVSTRGISRALRNAGDGPVLLLGYSPNFHRVAFVHAWRSGRPILLRAETADHTEHRSALKTAIRDRALQCFYAACTTLLYIGRNSEQHFRRLGVADKKLVFSPYCVDTACFQVDEANRGRLREAVRRELDVRSDQLVILFSGKLSRRKGVDLLLGAVKALPTEIRERILVGFLGSGELHGELKTQAAVSPTVRVHFCGFKNQTELSPYYHAADVLVLPSRRAETWGLVVNEALHHGLPCVVSRAVGCAPDLVEAGVTGDIAETDSVDSLTAALTRGLNLVGPEVRARCRERVSGYTVDRAAEGIARAYQAIVN